MEYIRERKNWFRLFTFLLLVILSFPLVGKGSEDKILSEFDIFNADIRGVFRSLADWGELKVLLEPKVQGLVTLKLKDGLPIKTAINLLAELHGYTCRWEESSRTVIIGYEKMMVDFDSKETRLYQLNHIQGEQIVDALKVVVPAERIGWDSGANQLTIEANALEHQNVQEIITSLAQELPQHVIEVKIAEIDLNLAKEKGLSWSLPSYSPDSSFRVSSLAEDNIRLLEAKNDLRILASSNLYAEDGRKGTTFVGDQYPVIISKSTSEGNVNLIEYKNAGVEITVTPQIAKKGEVTLALNLDVGIVDEREKVVEGNAFPELKSRQLNLIRKLQEGETCVISGIDFTTSQERKSRGTVDVNPKIKEGPTSTKTVCIFLTPRLSRTGETGKAGTTQGMQSQEKNGISNIQQEDNLQVTSEVIQIDILAVADEELPRPDFISQGEVLTEVVGFDQASSDKKEVSPIEVREEQVTLEKENKLDGASGEKSDQYNQPQIGIKVAYRINKGDTIFSIARKYGLQPESILKENALSTSDLLSIGKIIQIPIPVTHLYQLKPKETLWRIAKRYGITVEWLMEINNITDVTVLGANQVLILPVSSERIIDDKY
jgi:LysM repeat protein